MGVIKDYDGSRVDKGRDIHEIRRETDHVRVAAFEAHRSGVA
jgi:hypothetical protein